MNLTHFTKNIVSCVLISFFLFYHSGVSGQEMLGASLGNYNGLNGSLLNPSVMTNSRNYAEVNFLTADFFANNTAFYIPYSDISLTGMFRPDYEFPVYGKKNNSFNIYENRNLKSAVQNTRILGPSVMYQYGKHAFALTTGVRYMVTSNNIPWEIPVFAFESLDYEPLQNVNFNDYNIDAVTQAWMEVGLSYAYVLYDYMEDHISVGASIRSVWGYSGIYGEVNNMNYIVANDSTINIKNLNGQAAFALPLNYSTADELVNDPFFKGSGIGIDIGATYTRKRYVDRNRWEKPCEQRFEDYIYKIGFSILDIGRVKYKHNAQVHDYNDVSQYWINFDTISYTNVNQVVSEISDVFYGDPTASYAGDQFNIGLPMAVSLQFDYHLKHYEKFYVGAFWIQPIRFNMHTLRRPAQISVVPRYETKQLEFSLPITLFEYVYPRIGLAARFSFFTIGTERLGTYLGIGDLNGLDLYFSFKLNFGKGTCKIKAPIECLNGEYGYSDKEKAKFRKKR